MKARHLKNSVDTDLYKSILKKIKAKLDLNKKKANRYFLLKGLFYLVLAVSSYASIFIITHPVIYILNFILFGFIIVLLCFNFAHDFSHHSIFKQPFWDNLGFESIYTLVGAHPEAWKKRHISSHHVAPNVEHFDTDLAISGLIRVLPNSKLKWYHKYQYLYAPIAYMSYSLYWVFVKDFIVLKDFSPNSLKQKIRYYFTFISLKSFYILYLLIIPLVFSNQSKVVVLTAFLLMHLIQSLYTLFTFFITHHVHSSNYPKVDSKGVINTSWFMNQIKSSNDFYPFSNVANFIFGGVNNHIAHHLYPHISHYHYPKMNRILYDTLIENGIVPNQTTYLGGVFSHFRLLKLRGTQVDD